MVFLIPFLMVYHVFKLLPPVENVDGERKRRPPVNNFLFTKRTEDLTSVHTGILLHMRKSRGNQLEKMYSSYKPSMSTTRSTIQYKY